MSTIGIARIGCVFGGRKQTKSAHIFRSVGRACVGSQPLHNSSSERRQYMLSALFAVLPTLDGPFHCLPSAR